ncbi:MAG: pantetheine-phosphate adenylyltransferase [Clostridia bacterium]|nr:pantetheine-phosphate adenylyltransferase [Clostridia bacterium]
MKKCVFAGTFDPVTKGHEKVIEKASKLFDEVLVALCINAEKKTMFSVEERLEMLNCVSGNYSNVKVVYHEGMLVDLMKKEGIIYTVRGVRNATDYEYENRMHEFNLSLYPEIVTLYIPCSEDLKEVSSTAVKKDLLSALKSGQMLSRCVCDIIKKSGK